MVPIRGALLTIPQPSPRRLSHMKSDFVRFILAGWRLTLGHLLTGVSSPPARLSLTTRAAIGGTSRLGGNPVIGYISFVSLVAT